MNKEEFATRALKFFVEQPIKRMIKSNYDWHNNDYDEFAQASAELDKLINAAETIYYEMIKHENIS